MEERSCGCKTPLLREASLNKAHEQGCEHTLKPAHVKFLINHHPQVILCSHSDQAVYNRSSQ